MKKHRAFTLAEIMIAIGVIGAIAVLVLPGFIRHYNDRVNHGLAKKAKTVIGNGYNLMMSKEDVTDLRNLSMWSCNTYDCYVNFHKKVFKAQQFFTDEDLETNTEAKELLPSGNYTLPDGSESQFKWVGAYTIGTTAYTPLVTFRTGDSIVFGVQADMSDFGRIIVGVDVNGKKSPNIVGKDLYIFEVHYAGLVKDITDSYLPANSDYQKI